MKQQLDSKQIGTLVSYIIQNNVDLVGGKRSPVSLNIIGNPGIGKTSVIKQVAEKFDMHFVRVNLAEVMVEDIIGYPYMEAELTRDHSEKIWCSDRSVSMYHSLGYIPTGATRMMYAKPKWIQGKEDKPILLLLDDFNRALPNVMQSVMTIIDEQKYISWELPKGSTVLLSSNHDDGDMFVTTQDAAQSSRYLQIEMKPSVDAWAEWAEGYGMDSRCINFLLKNPEIIEGTSKDVDGQKLSKGNLRLWTKFFDAISGIPDFEKEMGLIMNIGSNSLPIEHITWFATFVKNSLDKLPSPKQLLNNDLQWSLNQLKSVIEKDGGGRARRQDIASIMAKRLLNYSLVNHAEMDAKQIDQYAEIIEAEILTPDLVLLSVKQLNTIDKFKKSWLPRPKIVKILVG